MPVRIEKRTIAPGINVPAEQFPLSTFERWDGGDAFYGLTDEDLWTFPPPASPKSSIVSVSSTTRWVSPSLFGMHVQQTEDIIEACQRLDFAIARTHDSGGSMRWHTLNPSSGVFDWANSDAWVDAMAAQGKDILFLLGFTPNWAAASTPGTGKYDNGTTVTGSNQPPSNMTYWSTFCTQVATRYGGRIKYYEIWNETNYSSYWAGTAAQLAQMTRLASQAIKAIDATAKIVAPIVQEPETGGTGNAYLGAFLDASDGASGTGKDWIDACGIHMYPPKYNFEVHKNQIDNVRATLAARSLSALEIWNTEVGVLQGTSIDDAVQSKWLARSFLLSAALGVSRHIWYSYDSPLMFMTQGDIDAYKEIRTALLSGPIVGCNIAPDGRVAAVIGAKRYVY